MDSQNRISQTSMTQTVGRQTPKAAFGDVLAGTVANALSVGGALASGITQGSPVLSAAVSGISAVVGAVASGTTSVGSPQVMSVGSVAPQSTVPGSVGGNPWDSIATERQQSMEYLNLQMAMQRESREYNAVSNILKVRHDSAKAAINNVR